jgi:hypothetical protein
MTVWIWRTHLIAEVVLLAFVFATRVLAQTASEGDVVAKNIAPIDPLSGSGGSSLVSAPLTVTETGSGMVTSSPAGIQCGATCSANFAANSPVTLTARPAAGWEFTGWAGACSGTGTCVVTMTAAQNVAAAFTRAKTHDLNDGGGHAAH